MSKTYYQKSQKTFSKVDNWQSNSVFKWRILSISSQRGLTKSHSQKIWIIVSGTFWQKQHFGESILFDAFTLHFVDELFSLPYSFPIFPNECSYYMTVNTYTKEKIQQVNKYSHPRLSTTMLNLIPGMPIYWDV